MDYAIELQNVCKDYDNFKLDHVSMNVPKGSVVGFVGENGAGKTTTIKAILNLISVDSGKIQVFGQDHVDKEREIKEQIGVVFDESCFHEQLTAPEIGKVMSKIYRDWQPRDFEEYLRRFQLPAQKKIKDYSRGMKMKLSIAVAMSHKAKLLILDEATSGLDPIVRDEILELFLDFIQDEEHTILVSSHIISDLEKIADYIIFIHGGKILFQKNKDELLYEYGIIRCSEEQFRKLDPKLCISYRKNQFGYEVLTSQRKEIARIYRDLVIDQADIENIILFYVKGVRL
ncbi:ABC transporter ATP-binding protein [Diplocloster modestus]|uniref:ABC transporter ATP-binding protein n=1 Tax=Diplocloster modestus TaxID=2850322 RepID=A0ABS6KE85_9FIRM|nr:ABC transporter ATP-binding protein [Diplocloster modestus]MBU9728841.1 ABC transporter ATP-binding protein [Diplocloster modestus]